LREEASRSKIDAARAFLVAHRRAALVSALLLSGVVVFALIWFQPHKLFIDERLDESLPEAIEPAAGEVDAQEDRGTDSTPSDDRVASEESAGPRTLREGSFRSLEHATSGKASVVRLGDGRRFLRFENLATSNGPDLRVYLSEVPASDDWFAYGERFIDLGPLKGNLGNQNYILPAGTDLSRYESAVIWCKRFTVGFGVAPLNT